MIKKRIYLLPVIILFCLFYYACGSSSDTTSKYLKKGTYDFILMDSLSIPLVEGVAEIDTSGSDVFGSYQIVKVADSTFKGYGSIQRGGEFKGHYDRTTGEVSMNMNPRVADANIFVSAKIYGTILRGTWSYSTFRGNTSGGNFKATRE